MKKLILTESGLKKFKGNRKKWKKGKCFVMKNGEWFEVEIDTSRQVRGYIPTPCNMEHLF